MKSQGGLIGRLVVVLFLLPGCGGTQPGAEKGTESAEGVPAHWAFQESRIADSFFGKGPRVRLFVGGPPEVYGTLNDPGAQIPLHATAIGYCGWKEDDDVVYSVRFEPAAIPSGKPPTERLKLIASLAAGYAQMRHGVFEKSHRIVDHQGRPACELEYERTEADMAKLPLSIVVRIVYIEENESGCFMQVSSRKRGPALRASDPKVHAFLTRSEIIVPKKAAP
jgi:hypothetical protein